MRSVLRLALIAVLGAAGCRQILGIEDLDEAPDAPTTPDGARVDGEAPDAMAPDATLAPCPAALPAGCTTGFVFECSATPGSCYAVCATPTVSAAAAEASCTTWGGHLASPSGEDHACAMVVLTAQPPSGDVWIGLRQVTGAGATDVGWAFIDGSTYPGVPRWHAGQPDDYNNVEDNTENCGELEPMWSWDWNDDACNDSQPYMCEQPR